MYRKRSSPDSPNCKTLSCRIGSIVSAACLAHDLGNPPFGHSGEKAISTFFSEGKGAQLQEKLSPMEWNDLTHFEGNANAFRLLTHQFEGRRKGGFVLTYSTLASIVKYPFSSSLAEISQIRILHHRRRGISPYRNGTGSYSAQRPSFKIRTPPVGLSGRSCR